MIVKGCIEFYKSKQAQRPSTQCATSSEAVKRFAKVLDGLADALRQIISDKAATANILKAQTDSTPFPGGLVDLNSFCTKLVAADVHPSLAEAAQAVKGALGPRRICCYRRPLRPPSRRERRGGRLLYSSHGGSFPALHRLGLRPRSHPARLSNRLAWCGNSSDLGSRKGHRRRRETLQEFRPRPLTQDTILENY